jgi:hypothetical protein
MSAQLNDPDRAALQGRLGTRLAAALGERAAALPHDIHERLRVGREQAVARARSAARAPAVPARSASSWVVATAGAGASTTTPPGQSGSDWGWRVASVFPLLMLLLGLLLIEHVTQQEQIMAAADIDAVLLADDLPPDAYADPGFAEFLRSPPPP